MIIAIDGPAGSGKSTAARKLAERLGIAYLDTGATYRAITLKALLSQTDMEDCSLLVEIARKADLRLEQVAGDQKVFLDGADVTRQIRSAEVSDNSHFVARCPAVREILVELQRKLGARLGDFVAEGRDQGSVVFPNAEMKFYLDAAPQVRARRRYAEMTDDGEKVCYEEVLRAIEQRDGRDRSRAIAPLVKPESAIEINTSDMTIDQVTDELARFVEGRR